jgi:hypothetical protein
MPVRTRRDLAVVASAATVLTLLGAVGAQAATDDTDGAEAAAAPTTEAPTTAPSTTTTTAAPTTTTTAAPPNPVDAAIHRWFPEQEARARDIAFCESTLNPAARSPGGGNHGLFQINNVHRGDFRAVTGVSWGDGRYDADANAHFARWLYDQQGWEPWACA